MGFVNCVEYGHKNALSFCYELTTFWNREFVAKVLISSKLWPLIPNRLKNCKVEYSLYDIVRPSQSDYGSATNKKKFNSWQFVGFVICVEYGDIVALV